MTKPTTDERLAELREQVANNMADAVVPGLLARLDQAEEERDDWRDGARKVLAEKCPTDEKHCSCVPVLRKRVRELEKDKSDYIETVYNCLVAAGAPEDIDEQERVLPQHGTKPSHFVAAMIRQARRDALRGVVDKFDESFKVAGDLFNPSAVFMLREVRGWLGRLLAEESASEGDA